MRTLKIYLYEITAGLALLALAHVCLSEQRVLPFAQILLTALYLLIAVATEAMIVSILRPNRWQVICMNALVAAMVCASAVTSDSSLKMSAGLPVVTFLLRALIATVSQRSPQVQVRRITAAVVGSTLVAETFVTLYTAGQRIYYDYYFYPKVKEGYVIPTRWQDFVGHAVFLAATILVLYLSYRLLKYAFRHESVLPGDGVHV
jgi:hypothetical protein